MNVLLTWMSAHHMHPCCSQRSEEGGGSFRIGVRNSGQAICGSWNSDSGLLQEQGILNYWAVSLTPTIYFCRQIWTAQRPFIYLSKATSFLVLWLKKKSTNRRNWTFWNNNLNARLFWKFFFFFTLNYIYIIIYIINIYSNYINFIYIIWSKYI